MIKWLYKRWQPLYSSIQSSVVPNVEFIQGVPSDLEDDDFFDPRINILLVLDDLFSEAGKDKRITDLFTEGSHHRSLSVISINQNLFGNKDPTQRRNCHYMVLFNNPVDKQSIMTLARQMYPGQSDILLKQFAKATKNAFGYLLIDLKPFTPENQRLKCTVSIPNTHNIAMDHVTPHDTIKEEHAPGVYHSSVGVQTVHIAEENLPENMDKGQACDDCGQLFDSVHDVQRHCPEHRDQKKRKYEDTTDSEQKDFVGYNEAYSQLWKRARETNDEKFENKYGKFIDNGEESDYAQEMAEERIQPYNERACFNTYTTLIDTYILPLKNSGTHQQIMAKIHKMVSYGINTTTAVTIVLRKHKPAFQDLFDTEFTEDEGSDEGETDEDVSSDEEERQ
ncbi:hypothetical protein MAR_015848 [Mya arenaria]|uniref:C2H2-type domain-containing protein n=1 Tax=Mya arenaria TaxID=6604 RepID=A0ABY7FLY5_MYAAR|nr:hypothetical protein MAR_015848 [Mya arenaria]